MQAREAGAYGEAAAVLQNALSSTRSSLGKAHLQNAHVYLAMCRNFRDQGKYEEVNTNCGLARDVISGMLDGKVNV